MQNQSSILKLLTEVEEFVNNQVPLTSNSTLVNTGEEVYRRKVAFFIQKRKAELGVRTY